MAKHQTAEIAKSDSTSNKKLYIERARKAFPFLVRQAKAGQTIYYSDLSREIGIKNPRNLNFILGSIGNTLIDLSKATKIDIPYLQCLVINKKHGLPGEGIGWFINPKDFAKLNKTQQQKEITVQLRRIFTFQDWDWVLNELGLEPIELNIKDELEEAKNFIGGGESEMHRKFKEYISENPQLIGLDKKVAKGQTEYPLPSGDKIDVLFRYKNQSIGIEVKSKISNSADILRGIFQCVKYKILIEAEQIVNNRLPDSRVILVLQGSLPNHLIIVKNLLGIEVIDNIN